MTVRVMWTTAGDKGDNVKLSTEAHACGFRAVHGRGYTWGRTSGPYAGLIRTYAQSTALITVTTFKHHLMVRKASL